LLRFARNDSVSACHCEEYSDEAISVKIRTGGNHLSGLHHLHRRYAIISTIRKRASPRIIRAQASGARGIVSIIGLTPVSALKTSVSKSIDAPA
jgi:hypothetical protein